MTLQGTGGFGGNPTITIDQTTGTYTLSGATASSTLHYSFDGNLTTIHTNVFGAASGSFTTSSSNFSFTANGSGGTSTFGVLNTTATISSSTTSSVSQVFDSTVDIKNTDTLFAHGLTLSVNYPGFTQPGTLNSPLLLDSGLSTSALPAGGATFHSFINSHVTGQNTADASITPANQVDHQHANVSETSNPFTIGNVLTISSIGTGSSDHIDSTTTVTAITATPEPATVAMALTALPLLGIGALIRRCRARA